MATRCEGLYAADRSIPENREKAPHQASVCAVRFVLGSGAATRAAVATAAGNSQFPVGAESGSVSAAGSSAVSAPGGVREGRCESVWKRRPSAGLGRMERTGQNQSWVVRFAG